MNFRDLEYLVAVADLGHFGQAAARCHASQSALSLQLQKLEAELGVQLIERTSRRVVVAPTGRPLVERARGILSSPARNCSTMPRWRVGACRPPSRSASSQRSRPTGSARCWR